jgi:mannitol-1-phosphate/altronate dehydrogenase
VGEIDGALVTAIRENGGAYTINVARPDGIDPVTVHGIEIFNPTVPSNREALIGAIAASDEMATALPSVAIYTAGNSASVVRLLADGLSARSASLPTVIYAAENHNHAAEILTEHLVQAKCRNLEQVQVLNTVIGKMSGVISDAATIARLGLKTITPRLQRAVLVEEFNRILISKVTLPLYTRGVDVFVEKPALLPFEEAKLYGHNAIHAMIAYLAELKGLNSIADAGQDPWIMGRARKAFIAESGAALIKRHAELNDPLFTEAGYRHYADDLLARMTNPHLNDLVARVGRDHARKLAYDDRLFGTIRLALEYGVQPANLALGAAAGVISMVKSRSAPPQLPLPASPAELTRESLGRLLLELWRGKTDRHADAMMQHTWDALQALRDSGMTP